MDPDRLDPTPDQRREMDAAGIAHELAELRKLPRAVLRDVSTRLTMVATTMAQNGKPDESAAVLHSARLLYLLAHETLPPALEHLDTARAGGVCPECGHSERRHSALVSSDAARFRCSDCACVRVER